MFGLDNSIFKREKRGETSLKVFEEDVPHSQIQQAFIVIWEQQVRKMYFGMDWIIAYLKKRKREETSLKRL